MKALIGFQLVFGCLVMAGSSLEIIAIVAPSSLPPPIGDVLRSHPLMAIHREMALVRYWTVSSNVLGVAIGIGFVAFAFGIWQGHERARQGTRIVAGALIASALAGQLVMSVYLYPKMRQAELIATIAASLGVLVFPILALVVLGRARTRSLFVT